jgi:hypothetical protein
MKGIVIATHTHQVICAWIVYSFQTQTFICIRMKMLKTKERERAHK